MRWWRHVVSGGGGSQPWLLSYTRTVKAARRRHQYESGFTVRRFCFPFHAGYHYTLCDYTYYLAFSFYSTSSITLAKPERRQNTRPLNFLLHYYETFAASQPLN